MPLRQFLVFFYRGNRFILPWVLGALMLLTAAGAATGADAPSDILTLEAIGTSQIDEEDPSSAEQAAIDNALELILDKSIATIVPSSILADNFEEIIAAFYGNAERFILNYKKLAVTRIDRSCRVLVQASVLPDGITDRIQQSGILIDRELTPRLLIMISEARGEKPPAYWWRKGAENIQIATERAIAADLIKRGITPVSHDQHSISMEWADYGPGVNDAAALEIGKSMGADFVLTGKASVVLPDNFTPENGGAVLGVLDARLLDVNTGSIVSVATVHRHTDGSADASDKFSAFFAVGKEAARRFAPAMVAAFEQQKNRPHVYRIRIQGAGYLAYLNTFRKFLDDIDRIDRPQINEMKKDEAVISVNFIGSARELAGNLMEAPSDRIAVTVLGVSDAGVVVELASPVVNGDLNETGETFRP